jgi:hypothetical protein
MIEYGKLIGRVCPFLVSPYGGYYRAVYTFVCILLSFLVLFPSFSLFGNLDDGTHSNIHLSKENQLDYLAFAQNASSSNETQVSDNFLTYENSTYGVKIMYPSGWDYYESGEYGGFLDIAVFQSPLEGRTDLSSALFSVSVDTLANKDQSLKEYFDQLIPSVQESMAAFNYKILESKVDNGVTVAGRPAYQTISTNTQDNMNFKTLEMGTIANGKAYIISYDAEEDEYPKHLPMVQQMINSFQITDIMSSSLSPQTQTLTPSQPPAEYTVP